MNRLPFFATAVLLAIALTLLLDIGSRQGVAFARANDHGANTPATGLPIISGTAQVGETLTVDRSGIQDANGRDGVEFGYQWQADDADIPEATESTYTLSEAVEGKAMRVQVSFTDDAGNDETLTSEDVAVWSATMTVEWVYQGYGYYSTDAKKAGSLSPASFQVDGTTYTVKMVETRGWMYIGVDRELPFDFVLELDGVRFASDDASFRSYSYGNIYKWERTGLSWRDGETVEVRLLGAVEDETAVNSAATGAPIVSGTAQVGETLTADTSGISDVDGMDDAAFAYQWLADDTEIQGATNADYTLADADEGRTVKVRVSFTDDAGNDETLTSAATSHTDESVAAETPYTYRIKAINEHGMSERSRWVHVETTAAPTPEGTPDEGTPEQSVSEGDTDLPNDNSTPGRVAVGGSATGVIGTPGDQDRFAVDLAAGRTYQFDLTGSPGGGGTLPDTFFRAIYNSEGDYQADSYNDDFEGGRDSRVMFTATESGTYYARVSGDRDEVGSYTLSVIDVTPQ